MSRGLIRPLAPGRALTHYISSHEAQCWISPPAIDRPGLDGCGPDRRWERRRCEPRRRRWVYLYSRNGDGDRILRQRHFRAVPAGRRAGPGAAVHRHRLILRAPVTTAATTAATADTQIVIPGRGK